MRTRISDYKLQLSTAVAGMALAGCVAIAPPVTAGTPNAMEAPTIADVPVETVQPAESPSLAAQSDTAGAAAVDALRYMREEEKLAHDVYVTLYDKWGLQVFANIANAESQHMDMVFQMLEDRGVADPAAGNGLGEFTNQDLQALYDAMVAEGSESVVAALTVGATIEDVDIADLREGLDVIADEDVRWVFENLLRGSENHMRAFVRNLARQGETYEPQYIDAEYYEAIVESDMARGSQGRQGMGGRRGETGAVRGGGWQR